MDTSQILSDDIKVVNLNGKFLMPGFQDAHLHLAEAGFNEIMCLFSEVLDNIADYENELNDCASEPDNIDAPWILGAGISVSEMLADTATTPREFLDSLFPNTPVLILDNVGHGGWVNSKAIIEAGFTVNDPVQLQGGILLTKGTNPRVATGVIFENAQQKFRDVAFQATDPDQSLAYAGLLKGLATMAENGITGVSDAGGYWTRDDHLLWIKAESENKMTVRASNALYVFPDRPVAQQIADINALFSNDPNKRVKFNNVKIYIDGILSLGTSSLKSPYSQSVVGELASEPSYDNGFQYFKSADLKAYANAFDATGFQMHFHATGDKGAGIALDVVADAAITNSTSDRRHRVTHAYIIDATDRMRFDDLGVVADFQLNPSSLTPAYKNYLNSIIGSSRSSGLIPVKSMLDQGAKVILSSDYDAGPVSPLGTIQRALSRPDNADQNVASLAQAIKMVTLDVAYSLQMEAKTGSIEVGKLADLVVLDKDITLEHAVEIMVIGNELKVPMILATKPN